jgi:hypothetical protein
MVRGRLYPTDSSGDPTCHIDAPAEGVGSFHRAGLALSLGRPREKALSLGLWLRFAGAGSEALARAEL